MVPDSSTSSTVGSPITDGCSGALINGLVGGVAAVVLSFVPLSTLLGGAIAGYLEGGRPEDGLAVGAIAGLVVLVPFVAILSFLLFFLGFAGTPSLFGIAGLFVVVVSGLYTVGLSVLGGYLGWYLRSER
ncbi:DUF5518 domain-containing protein [Halorarum salinum]|uniref:DUF5518 domain-containing protein n=1 Tax=Halorarum salinum TaxID=2743089 RepID=A0A7D5LAR9_9EURY|nr:DUF5518 domain-containing protein [Halobaculum salinum]QLG62272.1 DUF5518 domain-containing protein [Halobaculum salinum]